MDIEELFKYMLNLFEHIDKDIKNISNELSIADVKQQEILHYIENHKLSASQACKLIKELKKVRDERREIKNNQDIICSVRDTFTSKYKDKFIEKDLMLTLKRLKEIQDKQDNPTYTYKYLTEELEIRDE